jgi:hypothetical protein
VARLQSFNTWTKKPLLPTPEALAEAGFYYTGLCYGFFLHIFFEQSIVNLFLLLYHIFSFTGHNDDVSCFYCGTGLRDWLPQDVPFEEHARWAPFCVYLLFVKGPDYIQESRRKAKQDGRGDIFSVTLLE